VPLDAVKFTVIAPAVVVDARGLTLVGGLTWLIAGWGPATADVEAK
jgi:hypothetical protein